MTKALNEDKKTNKIKKNEFVNQVGTNAVQKDGVVRSKESHRDSMNDRHIGRAVMKMTRKPTKTMGEETEMEDTEITRDELLGEGPAALLDAIVNEDEDTPELFNAVMGAKIDAMLDLLKNELAAGMFETEPAVATEDFVAALDEAGVELTEEQLDELSKKKLGRYVNAASDDKANLAFDKGKEVGASNKKPVGHGAVYSAKETKRSRGIETAVKKLTKEDAADLIASLGIELTEEQADMIEASLWKPQEAGFTKKGIAPKGGVKKNVGEYDRKAHERITSVKLSDQLTTKRK